MQNEVTLGDFNMKSYYRIGKISFIIAVSLSVSFSMLKILSVVDWSWWLVLLPIIIHLFIPVSLIIILLMFYLFGDIN